MRLLIFLVLFAAAVPGSAQIYRWVDANGRVHFSNTAPPQGVNATVVDANATEAPSSAESTECYTIRCQGERMEERQRKRQSKIATPTTVRGSRNLVVAARTGLSMKTYTYMPTPADPFTTTITLVGGRVSDLERVRKF